MPSIDIRTAPAEAVVRFWSPLGGMRSLRGFLLLPFDTIHARLADPYSRALLHAVLDADAPEDIDAVAERERGPLLEGFARRLDMTRTAAAVLAGEAPVAGFADAVAPLAGVQAEEIARRAQAVAEPILGPDQPLPDFAANLAWFVATAHDKGVLRIESAGERCGFPVFGFAVTMASYGIDGPGHIEAVDRRIRAVRDSLEVKARMVAAYARHLRFDFSLFEMHCRVNAFLPDDVEYGGLTSWREAWIGTEGETAVV